MARVAIKQAKSSNAGMPMPMKMHAETEGKGKMTPVKMPMKGKKGGY